MGYPQFKNWYTDNTTKGELNEEASCTVPDQSLSIVDILDRFTRGLPLDLNIGNSLYQENESEFNDENFDTDIYNEFGHDITDVYEMKAAADNTLAAAKNSAEQGKASNVTTTNDDAKGDSPAPTD